MACSVCYKAEIASFHICDDALLVRLDTAWIISTSASSELLCSCCSPDCKRLLTIAVAQHISGEHSTQQQLAWSPSFHQTLLSYSNRQDRAVPLLGAGCIDSCSGCKAEWLSSPAM